jgi:nicotinamidase-related amidase
LLKQNMNTHLLVIDPQNDFCDVVVAAPPGYSPALPVAGADADLCRLAAFVHRNQQRIGGITVTLDSHPGVAVERTTFWVKGGGQPVPPFTWLTAADVEAGTYRPRDAASTTAVLAMLSQLAQRGREGLMVWPVHCVTGTFGHTIHAKLAAQLQAWETARQHAVRKVLKGDYPLSEHYGVFEADAPVAGVPSTQFNTALARHVTAGVDLLLLAGEAASHCVAASFDQLAGYLASSPGGRPRVVILRDCMSPVAGLEHLAEGFYQRARAFGADILSSSEAALLLERGNAALASQSS